MAHDTIARLSTLRRLCALHVQRGCTACYCNVRMQYRAHACRYINPTPRNDTAWKCSLGRENAVESKGRLALTKVCSVHGRCMACTWPRAGQVFQVAQTPPCLK